MVQVLNEALYYVDHPVASLAPFVELGLDVGRPDFWDTGGDATHEVPLIESLARNWRVDLMADALANPGASFGHGDAGDVGDAGDAGERDEDHELGVIETLIRSYRGASFRADFEAAMAALLPFGPPRRLLRWVAEECRDPELLRAPCFDYFKLVGPGAAARTSSGLYSADCADDDDESVG
jgi:hypothetical protein